MSKSKNNNKSKTVSDVLKPYEQQLDKLPDEKPLKAILIETPLGSMFAVSNERSVVFLMFTESRHFDREMKHLIKVHSKAIVEDDVKVKPLQIVESEIKAYFSGKLTEFDTPIEINEGATDFIRQVWDELQKIEYGKTITFSELAKSIGKPNGAQPVANACSRNSMSIIIPCHRIMSAGKTSVNNSCIERRNWLLDHEQKFTPKK